MKKLSSFASISLLAFSLLIPVASAMNNLSENETSNDLNHLQGERNSEMKDIKLEKKEKHQALSTCIKDANTSRLSTNAIARKAYYDAIKTAQQTFQDAVKTAKATFDASAKDDAAKQALKDARKAAHTTLNTTVETARKTFHDAKIKNITESKSTKSVCDTSNK